MSRIEKHSKETPLWRYELGYFLFAVFMFPEVVFNGAKFAFRDIIAYFYPLGEVISRAWQGTGSFLWDSSINNGLPLAARWTPAIFYPAHILFAYLQPQTAFTILFIIHLILAAVAMFHLALRFTDNKLAAWMGGLGYGFSGYVLSMSGGGFYLYSCALLPLSILALLRLVEKSSLSRALQLALILALQVLSPDPQTLFYEVLIFFPAIILFYSKNNNMRLKAVIFTATGGILAIGLSFCQLLPAFEFASYSVRANGFAYEELIPRSFHPLRLIEFIAPGIFGSITPQKFFWALPLVNSETNIPWTGLVYLGIFIIIGLLLIPLKERKKEVLFWSALVIFFLFLAFGVNTPFFKFFVSVLPGADRFRFPEKFLLFVTPAVILLGVMGLGKLLSCAFKGEEKGYFKNILGAIIGLVVLNLFFIILRIIFNPSSPETGLSLMALISPQLTQLEALYALKQVASSIQGSLGISAVLLIVLLCRHYFSEKLFAYLIVAIAVVDIFIAGLPLRNLTYGDWLKSPPEVCSVFTADASGMQPVIWRSYTMKFIELDENNKPIGPKDDEFFETYFEKLIKWQWLTLRPNTGAPYCVRYMGGYEAALLGQWQKLFEALGNNRDRRYDFLGTQFIFENPGKLDTEKYPVFGSFQQYLIQVHLNKDPLPFVFSPSRITVTQTNDDAIKRVAENDFDFRNEAILETSESVIQYPEAQRKVQVLHYRPGEINLSTDFAEDGYVVLLESYYPGWKATIGGSEVPVSRANGAFMGFAVPKGVHEITLSFEPKIQSIANTISLMSLFILVLLAFYCFLVNRAKTKEIAMNFPK